jgi:hypothetical protein
MGFRDWCGNTSRRYLWIIAKTKDGYSGRSKQAVRCGLPVIRPESAARVSTLTSIPTKSLQPQLDDVSFKLLRRSEQPTAVVHETICEQVRW